MHMYKVPRRQSCRKWCCFPRRMFRALVTWANAVTDEPSHALPYAALYVSVFLFRLSFISSFLWFGINKWLSWRTHATYSVAESCFGLCEIALWNMDHVCNTTCTVYIVHTFERHRITYKHRLTGNEILMRNMLCVSESLQEIPFYVPTIRPGRTSFKGGLILWLIRGNERTDTLVYIRFVDL